VVFGVASHDGAALHLLFDSTHNASYCSYLFGSYPSLQRHYFEFCSGEIPDGIFYQPSVLVQLSVGDSTYVFISIYQNVDRKKVNA